eukprot:9107812-Pyramimonas_sp.AAC.1
MIHQNDLKVGLPKYPKGASDNEIMEWHKDFKEFLRENFWGFYMRGQTSPNCLIHPGQDVAVRYGETLEQEHE